MTFVVTADKHVGLSHNAKAEGLYVFDPDDTFTQRSPGAWEDYLFRIKRPPWGGLANIPIKLTL